jgi:hypothetical protein
MKLIDNLLKNALVKSSIVHDIVTAIEHLALEMAEVRKSRNLVADVLKTHTEALKQQNILINDLYERQALIVEQTLGVDVTDTIPVRTSDDSVLSFENKTIDKNKLN